MNDYYYIGTAKIIGADRMVLIKTGKGYLSAGNIVAINTGVLHNMAEVICTSLVHKGSDEEAIMTSIATAYEVEKIYTLYWEKNEEVTEDGN